MMKVTPPTGKRHPCLIKFTDHTGDSVVATYDRELAETMEIATADLDKFWGECIEAYKNRGVPLVSGQRADTLAWELMERGDTVAPYVNVLFTPPLTGG